jgi:hypothetical protein
MILFSNIFSHFNFHVVRGGIELPTSFFLGKGNPFELLNNIEINSKIKNNISNLFIFNSNLSIRNIIKVNNRIFELRK